MKTVSPNDMRDPEFNLSSTDGDVPEIATDGGAFSGLSHKATAGPMVLRLNREPKNHLSREHLQERFRGILLGTAVGDSLGLPLENLTPQRAARLFPGPIRHRFLPGYGMISDDTDHTLFVAQSLLAHPDSPADFSRRLAFCLRWWLVSLPAGVGFATLRAILWSWLGKSPESCGVFSAGNGPAMRSAIIGAFFENSPERKREFVQASTTLTHTDPKAETGAQAVADIAAWGLHLSPDQRPALDDFIDRLNNITPHDPTWKELVQNLKKSLHARTSTTDFAAGLGLAKGVSGYTYHTVPVVLHAWYSHFGNFEGTLETVIRCGGDADTTGAIAGALAGAITGESGIPSRFLDGLIDWPRGLPVIKKIADELAKSRLDRRDSAPISWPVILVPLRNLVFLGIILGHVIRRMLPPYS